MDSKDPSREFKRFRSSFYKSSRIKECFHFDHSSCSNNIISAHSLQRSGVLDLLEEEVNGNLSIYSFLNIEYDSAGKASGFTPLGKKSASTFYGFCGYHDTEVFKKIENNDIDLENDEHCFLLSYRGFAKEYHAKKETLQGYQTNEFYQKRVHKSVRNSLIESSKLGLRDCEIVKSRLNQILRQEQYSELEYCTCSLHYPIPIALSSSFNPEYSIRNEPLNVSTNSNDYFEFVFFSVQPTRNGETFILLSCLPEHTKSVKFIDQISSLRQLKFEKVISSLIVAYIENTFISPSIWNKLSSKSQQMLLFELDILATPTAKSSYRGFYQSGFNFFEKKFQKKLPS